MQTLCRDIKKNGRLYVIYQPDWKIIYFIAAVVLMTGCDSSKTAHKEVVDYVNPYMGNISHLLVPTYPTIHLPGSIMRVYPERDDFTGDMLKGFPLIVTGHRGISAFNLSPFQGEEQNIEPVIRYSYDQEEIKPYFYSVFLSVDKGVDFGMMAVDGVMIADGAAGGFARLRAAVLDQDDILRIERAAVNLIWRDKE